MISYRVTLDAPRELVSYVSRLLKTERRRRGTRKCSTWWQDIYRPAWFRDGGDIPQIGRGVGLSRSTSYRHLDEVIDVLAEQAPEPRAALECAHTGGLPHLIIDGALVDTDRVSETERA